MKMRDIKKLDRELTKFCDEMFDGMGRRERRAAMRHYLTGLLLEGDRKSVEPMARRLIESDSDFQSMRQRLLQVVADSRWAEGEIQGRLAKKIDSELPDIEAFVVDDTGFPKKGAHSVGVARQYSGTLGRTDNCQVATSLSLAGMKSSACIAMRLYLSDEWASDLERRKECRIPDDVHFQTKLEIALLLIDAALGAGVRHHTVLANAGYGDSRDFREALTARKLAYVVGIAGNHLVWPPGAAPKVPKKTGKVVGRPNTVHVDDRHAPIAIKDLVASLGRGGFKKVTWRAGTKGPMSSNFAALRVRSAEGRTKGKVPGEIEWLLCEWPHREKHPTKFYLSTLSARTSIKELVRVVKLRWRIERDYQEMKGELGLDHFEGRTWPGFHHHTTLCSVAYAFLALRRALFPPVQSALDDRNSAARTAGSHPVPRWKLPTVPSPRRHARDATRALSNVVG